MFFLSERLVLSPSDLRQAAACEYALAQDLEIRLGRVAAPPVEPDPMLTRIAELGTAHEQQELRRLRAAHPRPGAVLSLGLPHHTEAGLEAARERTLAALADPAVEVIAQGTVYDGTFVGHIDFLERTAAGWLISDTKLARATSVSALLQVAAYAHALLAEGVPLAPVARLVLGSGVHEDYRLAEIIPVYRARRQRLDSVVDHVRAQEAPAQWGDDAILACGRCETCAQALETHDDVLLVAGVRAPTRRRLIEAGVQTRRDLAARREQVPGIRDAALERLREQARLQVAQLDAAGELLHEVADTAMLRRLPRRSDGDVFFDFEGDPMWVEPGEPVWGLEYLFGLIEVDQVASGGEPSFRAFWAHDRTQERAALEAFVAYLHQRRSRWPDLHVYHYAPYETAALLRLAARHGVCEDDIDQFLREGVFVDLYRTVRGSIRISDRSYSLKKVESLYRGERDKDGVSEGAASIVAYHEFTVARDAGRADVAAGLLDEIRRYNEDDCRSTYQLREWLLGKLGESSGSVRGELESEATAPGADESAPATVSEHRQSLMDVEARLRDLIKDTKPGERNAYQQVVALSAASVLFHAREDKPMWQRHYERLRTPVRDWRARDEAVFVVTDCEVVQDWEVAPPKRSPRRLLRLTGEPLKGRSVQPGSGSLKTVYPTPAPAPLEAASDHLYCPSKSTTGVLEVEEEVLADGGLRQHLIVEELSPSKSGHADLPVALVELGSVPTKSIDEALATVGEEILLAQPELPTRAGIDVLAGRAPRLRDGGPLPPVGDGPDGYAQAITAALLAMDDSYVAVQGPPGTGKTYVGGRVIAELVREHGWRVGVCSQSHKAIENILDSVIDAGLPGEQVAKHTRETERPRWRDLSSSDELADFAAEQGGGYVIGGTAWDLTKPSRVQRGQLDLVVIDEAGQYSLAKTLAVSIAGDRLLLLGDPAQLPQVSTGTHPEPIDASALGWLLPTDPAQGRTLPPSHGYFLERTWRLHPSLAEPISDLAYDGALRAQESISGARSLAGIRAGLHRRIVTHRDNATSSPEEAAEVVALVTDLVGRAWHDPGVRDSHGAPVGPRPLRPRDIIVITPYNNQAHLLRATLADAGFGEVPVGTVDKFQGQEAAVAILSLAASSPGNITRGIRFLLDRNRLNVALSRGQVAAYIVHSDVLTDFAPGSPSDLICLGTFLQLCTAAQPE